MVELRSYRRNCLEHSCEVFGSRNQDSVSVKYRQPALSLHFELGSRKSWYRDIRPQCQNILRSGFRSQSKMKSLYQLVVRQVASRK